MDLHQIDALCKCRSTPVDMNLSFVNYLNILFLFLIENNYD